MLTSIKYTKLEHYTRQKLGRVIFSEFQSEKADYRRKLKDLKNCLLDIGYTTKNICQLLDIPDLQSLQSPYFHYFDHYKLPQSPLADLIRLFLLSSPQSKKKIQAILGKSHFELLTELGVLIPRKTKWCSQINLFVLADTYIATDPQYRFTIWPEEYQFQDPVMYLSPDSVDLFHVTPQPRGRVLDLGCGSGIQGIMASSFATEVVGVDVNPRAIRFSRFNAQFNGVRNIRFVQGSLYEPVKGQQFEVIVANPPFIPAATQNRLLYRDGGASGETILSQIITESANHLTKEGKLFTVTDLFDLEKYEKKLSCWWKGGPADILVLKGAIVPKFYYAYGHIRPHLSYSNYVQELDCWLQCLKNKNSIAQGFIVIYRRPKGRESSFHLQEITHARAPIRKNVEQYFRQKSILSTQNYQNYRLSLSPDVRFRTELLEDPTTHKKESKIKVFSPTNPFFPTYTITPLVYELLQNIQNHEPQWQEVGTDKNTPILHDFILKGILSLRPLSKERLKGEDNSHDTAGPEKVSAPAPEGPEGEPLTWT